jgi:hypothetical protein
MPQEGLAVHWVFFGQQVEQPVMMDAAQISATSVMMDFIFWFSSMFRPPAQAQTNQFATAASLLES